jgi:phage protein U
MPELTGGDTALSLLKLMADQGKAWPLLEGTGMIYGFYAIESMDTTRCDFFSDGKARRIEFTITLKRTDDTLMDRWEPSHGHAGA